MKILPSSDKPGLSKDAKIIFDMVQNLRKGSEKLRGKIDTYSEILGVKELRNGSESLDRKINVIRTDAGMLFDKVKELRNDPGKIEEAIEIILGLLEDSTLLKFALIHWELLPPIPPGTELLEDDVVQLVSFLKHPKYAVLREVKILYERRMGGDYP
ncbi:hypothetical protein N7478_003784 [Penicillium angulare]|uniref:uncharacterized protein n=1 Tax=Penicillium angulare TaxID=116970 RepID=UPI00253F8239|nr:uncharacterized protein N7478_003784 [Penicillium angulare]KAJ5288098.1 hypothetical protein N7478_003784 [Penicillium angulare]